MSDYVTKDELNTALKAQTDKIAGIFHNFMQQVDGRFNKIESDINELKDSHNRLLYTLVGFLLKCRNRDNIILL